MGTQTITQKVSEDEYLELDRANDFRSQYINGEMVAMSGGSPRHALIILNCGSEIRAKLAGRSCYSFSPEIRVFTPTNHAYVYPDVTVVCHQPLFLPNAPDVLTNPSLLLEVLSPSTETFDKTIKFSLYRDIESLNDYLMVRTDRVNVWHYSRQADGSWNLREYSKLTDEVQIPALNIALLLSDLYGNAMDLSS